MSLQADPPRNRSLMVGMPSVHLVEVALQAGLDSIILDMEHGFPEGADLAPYVGLSRAYGTKCLVRIPPDMTSRIGRLLDQGLDGIVLSLVRTPSDVERALLALHFPPLGNRSLNPFVPAAKNMGDATDFRARSSDVDLWIMAETVEIAESFARQGSGLQEWKRLTNVAGLLIGPYDLELSIQASPNQTMSLTDAIRALAAGAVQLEWAWSIFTAGKDQAVKWAEMGLAPTHMVIGYDREMWFRACKSQLLDTAVGLADADDSPIGAKHDSSN